MRVVGDDAFARISRHLLERRDVDDPEATAVRRRDQLTIARMNLEVVDRRCRKTAGEALPRLPTIDRGIGRTRRADEQQITVIRILTHYVDEIGVALVRQATRN